MPIGEPFLALAARDRGRLVLERCFDPTRSNRLVLAAGEEAGEGDYLIAESAADGARVLERLAPGGSALATIFGLAVRHGLDPVFPSRVRDDVQSLLESPGIDDPSLKDLRGLPFCTVDGAATRDLDQALHVARTGTGFRLHYALADASWFAPLGSALFEEALRRAASFYLPGLVVPMLPRPLSEGIVSLGPEVPRRALIMTLDLDAEGRVKTCDWVRSRIRSRAKLSFEQVERMLAGDLAPVRELGADAGSLLASLNAFRDLGEALARRRDREGVVRYRRDEVDMTLAPDGRGLVPLREIASPAERWNEEVSVLCNSEGARYLAEGDTPEDGIDPVYRVHPPPPPEALDGLERRIASFAALHGLDPAVWTWRRDSGQTLAEYLRSLPKEGESGRLASVIHRQAVVANLRSVFSAEPAPHSGVGSAVYGRFTAPMREAVGIYLHHETIEKLDGLPASGSVERRNLLRRAIDGANRARELQSRLVKDVNRLAMDALFGADLALPEPERPRRSGTVMGLRDGKLYCLLDSPPLEVKVYTADLAEAVGEPVAMDGDGSAIRARSDGRVLVRLGDSGRLYVRRFDASRDRWGFGLVAG